MGKPFKLKKLRNYESRMIHGFSLILPDIIGIQKFLEIFALLQSMEARSDPTLQMRSCLLLKG